MSSFRGFTLNGKYFTKKWILQNYLNLSTERLTESELKTLKFSGQWLSGAQDFIIQTSGSTGKPKAIRLTRSQMNLSARMTGEALNLKQGDRAFVCLSPTYISGIMMLVRGFVLDLELTIVEPTRNPFDSLGLENYAQYECTKPFDFAAFVPLQLQTILSLGPRYLSLLNRMKAILVGGAPVSLDLLKKLQRVEAPVYHTFGMTETASHIALRRLNGPEPSESYEVLPTVEIGEDAKGCLTIMSPLTNNQLVVTNDLVEVKSEKSFIWLGRVDNVINTGGIKVRAEKVEKVIEEALYEIDHGTYANREFFVGPLSDDKYGQVVTAVFEGPEFSTKTKNNLLKTLSDKLSKFEIPRHFCFVDPFIRSPNTDGKIDRGENLKIVDSNCSSNHTLIEESHR